ncbi:hypothetical protein EVAR_80278_1 [Eumeta japonica]|uniref:Uncharacterized protein n=1 Tax=Eumeta variegata TaxID=151549 RepID=A0A4C1UB82_EUMVA|nr:hypothetical protein EVAR_80278_1 [Eumeta japonica]
MKQRLLQLNLFLSEWKGRVPFTLCLSLSLLGGLTMPEWKGRLSLAHCERITSQYSNSNVEQNPPTPGQSDLERDTPTPGRSDVEKDVSTPSRSDSERDVSTPSRSDSERGTLRPNRSKSTKNAYEEALRSVNEHFKRPRIPENRFEVYGRNVGMKLQELPKQQRIIAEKIINETLFLAEMVAGHESAAVKRKMSDTHDEQSQNTDEETVETSSTEPDKSLVDSVITKNVPSKPAQETLMKKIGLLQQRINVLTEARNTEKLEKTERQRNNPAAKQPRTGPGQPPLVDSQPALLETIINIAIHGSAADERRRTEMIRSCLALSDLHERLLLMGLQISRSGTYLHLLPRISNTQEGRRHVRTVPVKLARPQTEMHKKHDDGEFCTATIRSLESLASLLGPQHVFILSQDDTYAGVNVEPNNFGKEEAVGYSGPTHISIRSGKHSSSTANTHAYDFKSLLSIPSFKPLMMTESNTVKPVIIIFVDGGPDENPRYRKVKNFAIEHFKNTTWTPCL